MMNTTQKILIIEDEKPLLFGLSALMAKSGYEVHTADNGEAGLDLAKNELPDIIISDVMMPPPNGFELRELLNDDNSTSSIPFIFLTALTKNEEKLIGLKLGADDYITKPFEYQELLARVDSILRRRDIERGKGRMEMAAYAQAQMEAFKREILQNFHHELTTPLVNILLPLEAAVSKKFSEPEELIRFTQIALSNADRLNSLVEDFILLTSIDHGKINTIRQELNPEIDIVKPIRKYNAAYQEKELDVELDLNIQGQIYAPRREFKKVIVHLVDNAFKFSSSKGKVRIALNAYGDGGCKMIVQDEGPGIPSNQRDKVFERYYQISQGDSRAHEGMGIGLTLAKSIMEALDGEVKILEAADGCVVELNLPPGKNGFVSAASNLEA
jgi:DNA-binding response OmpR family regulator